MNSSGQKSPLVWFILLWVGLIYLQNLQTALQKQDLGAGAKVPLSGPGNSPQLDLAAFTLLLALHGGLHWIAFSLHRTRDLLLYFLGQGILVLLISFLAHAESAMFGLCLALTIEAITLLKSPRLVLPVGVGYLFLFGVIEGARLVPVIGTGPLNKLSGAILDGATLILFVIACAMLYILQGRAHRRDQAFMRELEMAHADLMTAHGQLEEYATRVEGLTLIAERQRLARELHDTLAQGLVGLTMQLETIDALLLKQQGQQARALVQLAMARARATMTEARSAIEDLRAQTWETSDFSQAVQREIHRFTAATGIPCTCSLPQALPLPTPLREHLLRLVAEGLMNIARHARATRAWVGATCDQEQLMFEIGDDGVGFDPAVVARQAGHYGLLGLRERARLLQGHLAILSAPGKGTTIRLQLLGQAEGTDR